MNLSNSSTNMAHIEKKKTVLSLVQASGRAPEDFITNELQVGFQSVSWCFGILQLLFGGWGVLDRFKEISESFRLFQGAS